MIKLIPIDESNFHEIIKLKVLDSQKNFVATNMYSIAHAYVKPHLQPRAIMDDNKLVGFLMYTLDDEDCPDKAALWRLMISPEFQGKGYGFKALNTLIEYLKTVNDIHGLATTYKPNNKHAAALYRKVGMMETGKMFDGELEAIMSW